DRIVEYPLAITLIFFLLHPLALMPRPWTRWLPPRVRGVGEESEAYGADWWGRLLVGWLRVLWTWTWPAFGLSMAVAFAFAGRPDPERTVLQERTFFGVLTVYSDGDPAVHSLYHGRTLHGLHSTDV